MDKDRERKFFKALEKFLPSQMNHEAVCPYDLGESDCLTCREIMECKNTEYKDDKFCPCDYYRKVYGDSKIAVITAWKKLYLYKLYHHDVKYDTAISVDAMIVSVEKFKDMVENGSVVDSDGIGYPVKNFMECDQIPITASTTFRIPSDATHISYYNK